MRDDETASSSPVQAPQPADDVASTDDGATTDDQMSAELSRAAREAVRHPADPRIDRQLARMGLAPGPDEGGAATAERPSARAQRSDELDGLRTALADAQSALDRARRRLDVLTAIVAIEGVALTVVAVLVVLR